MKFIVIFLSVGIGLLLWGLTLGAAGWLPLWFGASFFIVAIAYLGVGDRVFGKKSDGKIAWWSLFLLFPYRLINLGFWNCQKRYFQEECCHKILPNLWLGRRATADELPDNISLVVDLTAEFAEYQTAIAGKTYLCVPTLDASAPSDSQFVEAIEQILAWQGNIYLHCALGHGRAATLAAGILLAKGVVKDIEEAEKFIQQIRPLVALNKEQKALLDRTLFSNANLLVTE